MMGIYAITNTVNGKRYIGMSNNIKVRWKNHKTELKRNKHHSSKLQNAWNKYGKDAFEFEVLYEADYMEGLELIEKELIKEYDSFKNGYNCSDGGEKLPGYVMPEKTRQALLKSNKGNKHFEGKKHDEDTKRLMSEKHSGKNNPFYGKTHRDEVKRKISIQVNERYQDETYRSDRVRWITELNKSEKRRQEVSAQVRGENNTKAKISEKDAIMIRLRYLNGDTPSKVQKDYDDLSVSGIRKICTNKTWKHIPNTIKELQDMLINYQC